MAMDKEFREWLDHNKYGTYKGFEIKPETQLVSYTYVISAVIITYRKSTRYYFAEVEKGKARMAQFLCNLCNLIVGWWGFPWGPIWTIKETFCNLADPDVQFWAAFAGKPDDIENIVTEQSVSSFTEREDNLKRALDEAKEKRTNKDVIIYVIIGVAVLVGCLIAGVTGIF